MNLNKLSPIIFIFDLESKSNGVEYINIDSRPIAIPSEIVFDNWNFPTNKSGYVFIKNLSIPAYAVILKFMNKSINESLFNNDFLKKIEPIKAFEVKLFRHENKKWRKLKAEAKQ